MSRSRAAAVRVGAPLAIVAVSLAVALGIAEAVLRSAGHRPWQFMRVAEGEPRLHEPHPEFGWWNREGAFVWGKRTPALPPIRMTFWPGGLRTTGSHGLDAAPKVLVLGGSFTQGWAVSDELTYAWRLQAAFPDLEFLNFGTAAYGTYQSLLRLEDYLADAARPPELVIYGFADFHEARNVAAPSWLRGVTLQTPGARLPYATLDESGALVRWAPAAYPAWPLQEASATVALVQDRWFQLGARGRASQARAVTRALLKQMDEVCAAHGSRLLVALLAATRPGSAREYRKFLAEAGIAALDCSHPEFSAPSMKVPAYGHPNAAMNAHWARCIERGLRRRLPRAGG